MESEPLRYRLGLFIGSAGMAKLAACPPTTTRPYQTRVTAQDMLHILARQLWCVRVPGCGKPCLRPGDATVTGEPDDTAILSKKSLSTRLGSGGFYQTISSHARLAAAT